MAESNEVGAVFRGAFSATAALSPSSSAACEGPGPGLRLLAGCSACPYAMRLAAPTGRVWRRIFIRTINTAAMISPRSSIIPSEIAAEIPTSDQRSGIIKTVNDSLSRDQTSSVV